jgi:hypothetical protein
MEKVIVLGVSYYKFKDEGTGEMREGGTVHYISDYAFKDSEKKGSFPIKVSADAEITKQLLLPTNVYPAWVELFHVNVPDAKGKAVPKLVKVQYKNAIDLQSIKS